MSCGNKSDDSMLDLELKLEVCGSILGHQMESLNTPAATTSVSLSSSCSCLSFEADTEEVVFSSSAIGLEAKSMVLVGCQRCLVYVMISDDRIRCPKCESTAVLLIDGVKDCAVAASEAVDARCSR